MAELRPLGARDAAAAPRGRSLVVRTGISPVIPVARESFEHRLAHAWRFGGADYLDGTVERARLDVDAIGLPTVGRSAPTASASTSPSGPSPPTGATGSPSSTSNDERRGVRRTAGCCG